MDLFSLRDHPNTLSPLDPDNFLVVLHNLGSVSFRVYLSIIRYLSTRGCREQQHQALAACINVTASPSFIKHALHNHPTNRRCFTCCCPPPLPKQQHPPLPPHPPPLPLPPRFPPPFRPLSPPTLLLL